MYKRYEGCYRHRGFDLDRDNDTGYVSICRTSGDWTPDYTLYEFKTFTDARQYIDMIEDSTNTRKPRVVDIWWNNEEKAYYSRWRYELIGKCKREGCEYLGEELSFNDVIRYERERRCKV